MKKYSLLTLLIFGSLFADIGQGSILPEIAIKQNMEGITTSPVSQKKLSAREKRREKYKAKTKQPMEVEEIELQKKVEDLLATPLSQEDPTIDLNFENADLQNMVDYIAELFEVSFIPDDAVKPMLQTGKGVSGNKITFRTEKPMTKRAVWSIFTTFLDMTGLSVAETPVQTIFRITSAPNANKLPLQAFIGVSPDLLPDNDNRIRYVYFLANATVDSIKPIIDQMRSTTSSFTAFVPLRALILTDKAYNIKALMRIVRELDKANMPETLSVLKLKYAAAEDVKKLFDELTKSDDQRGMVAKIFGAKKQTESFFFPENTRLIAEPRTNSLVLFGTQDTIKKIEKFIATIDTQLNEEISPLYIYELQFTDATSMADILNKVTQFGIGTTVGQAGGVQNGEKYFKPITFTPEKSGNRLIVKGDYEDYIKAKEIIEKLDVPQPQVAIEVLIVDVTLEDSKVLGTQWRNKNPGVFNKNVNFQNSGLFRSGLASSPVVDTTTGSILANLIVLATGNEAGSSLLSLGPDGNIWAMIKALSTVAETRVVSNPFLTTSNKYKATVSLGTTRRVNVGQVVTGGNSFPSQDDLAANLVVVITPQINSDGIVQLDVSVEEDTFTSTDPSSGTRDTKTIQTKAALANKQILAIGGLIRTEVDDSQNKFPILGDIPILGWFFKNRQKNIIKTNTLVFISPEIISPRKDIGAAPYTNRKAEYSRQTLNALDDTSAVRDPIHRWFFAGPGTKSQELDEFMERKRQALPENTSDYYPNRTTHQKPTHKKDDPYDHHVMKKFVPEQPVTQPATVQAPQTLAQKNQTVGIKPKRSLVSMIEPSSGAAG